MFGCWGRISSVLHMAACSLCSHMAEGDLVFLIRTLILLYQALTLMTSFNPNYLLKGHSNTVTQGLGHQHSNGGGRHSYNESIALSYEMDQSGRQEPEQVGPVGCGKSDNLT